MVHEEDIDQDVYDGEGNDADAVLAGMWQQGQWNGDVSHVQHGVGRDIPDVDFPDYHHEPWEADANAYGGYAGYIPPGYGGA